MGQSFDSKEKEQIKDIVREVLPEIKSEELAKPPGKEEEEPPSASFLFNAVKGMKTTDW